MPSRLPSPGEIVGDRYIIERPLAEGGMGAVFVARHQTTEAKVALKVLKDEALEDRGTRLRFLREAKVAAALGHPGIVKVFDAGEDPKVGPFLAMELLEGEALDCYLVRASPPLEERLSIVREMLEALAAAHEAGIVHRDVKPENVFLARDGEGGTRVKLLDFGIARVQSASTHTMDGSALGTIYYMAPEQMMDARRASAAADVWSVGVMLFELIAGALPFDGETIHEVAVRVCTAPVPSLSEAAPNADPALVRVVKACLMREVEARPPHARALAMMLDEIGITPVRAPRVSVVASTAPPWSSTTSGVDATIEATPEAPLVGRDSLVVEAPSTAVDRGELAARPTRKSGVLSVVAAVAMALSITGWSVRSMRSREQSGSSSPASMASMSATRAPANDDLRVARSNSDRSASVEAERVSNDRVEQTTRTQEVMRDGAPVAVAVTSRSSAGRAARVTSVRLASRTATATGPIDSSTQGVLEVAPTVATPSTAERSAVSSNNTASNAATIATTVSANTAVATSSTQSQTVPPPPPRVVSMPVRDAPRTMAAPSPARRVENEDHEAPLSF
jgi:serine/threonine-protein kinase